MKRDGGRRSRLRREVSPLTKKTYEERLARYVSGGKLSRSVDHLSSASRVVLRAALEWKGLSRLADRVPYTARARKDVEVPPSKDLDAAEKAIEKLAKLAVAGGWRDQRKGAAALGLLIMLRVGFRVGEFRDLPKTAMLEGTANKTMAVTGKGDYETTVALSKSAVAALLEYVELPKYGGAALRERMLAINPEFAEWTYAWEVLSTSRRGAYDRLLAVVREVTTKAGLSRRACHYLRHCFATRLLRNGAPVAVLQRALRHASPVTSLGYAHALTDDVAKYL